MNTRLVHSFLLLALSAGIYQAAAQGTAFSYSGQLQFKGSPANGLYDFQFALSNAPSGGSQIGYTLSVPAVGVTNGLFNTTLDFGGVFNGTALYLGISVCSNGVGNYQALAPLQPMLPTPYAITAEGLSATAQFNISGLAIQQNADGAPNFIGGSPANYVSGGVVGATIGGGGATNYNASLLINSVSADFGAVGGGAQNIVTGQYGTVGGGAYNTASIYDTVGGGSGNTAGNGGNGWDTVGGGENNNASGGNSTVSGGSYNMATGSNSTVAGGENNNAGGGEGQEGTSVGGGGSNLAGGSWSVVGGGNSNSALNDYATVPGGRNNLASGQFSFAAGYSAQATNDGAFVWADGGGLPFYSTNNNSFNVRANGGVVFVTGGAGMTIDGQPVLMGGQSNPTFTGTVTAPNYLSDAAGDFVAGIGNTAGGGSATVGGGQGNYATAGYATVGGGYNNLASGQFATVGGGYKNLASGGYATVGGGVGNYATNYSATVPGGFNNVAGGLFSFAAGNSAQATNDNAFVWSDGSAITTSTANNQFMVRSSGGVIIYSSSGNSAGVSLAAGGGSWSSLSDRNSKDDFAPVTPEQMLARVAALPITQWSYKTEQGVRHVGPMAQDFYAAFGVGEDNKHITTVDEGGVALAAIQGLNQKVEELKAELNHKDVENAELKQRLEALEKIVFNRKLN
jgi:hypothetical protein